MELNKHSIHPYLRLSLDHVPLSVSIAIFDEDIVLYKHSIAKNNEEEISFINDVSCTIKSINISDLSDSYKLEEVLWQPLDTQDPMISLMSKPQRRSIMWEFTRKLNKESLLN